MLHHHAKHLGEMSRQGTGTERWEKAGGRGKREKRGEKILFLGIAPALGAGLRDVRQDTERAARCESAQECAVTGATRSALLNDLERFFS